MIYLIWLAVALALFTLTFIFFVAIMKMREVKDEIFRLHWSVRWLCYGILAVGLVLDTLLNWIVLTVSFYELPQEFLSTSRVVRHKYNSGGFRQLQANWWCKNWLTPFDSKHCED